MTDHQSRIARAEAFANEKGTRLLIGAEYMPVHEALAMFAEKEIERWIDTCVQESGDSLKRGEIRQTPTPAL